MAVLCLNTVLYSVDARKRLAAAGFALDALSAIEEEDPGRVGGVRRSERGFQQLVRCIKEGCCTGTMTLLCSETTGGLQQLSGLVLLRLLQRASLNGWSSSSKQHERGSNR